jgi:signal transduction histidine kinase
MNVISREEHEYLNWLTRIETRAIIPLKWAILVVSLSVWMWSAQSMFPATEVFMMFFLYFMFNIAQSYFFYARRVLFNQVKPFCYVSYFIDIAFVSILIYMDTTRYYGQNLQSDFYILYFLMILRGFALFRRSREAIFTSILISGFFIVSIRFRETSFDFIRQRTFAFKFALIWMVSLMSWFIVEMINSQKSEIFKIKESLLRSEQFATLGQLAAGVAHEINNPIGIISAYSEYLLKKTPEDDPLREDYQTLHKEALRCEKIVSRLLNFANPSAREIVMCDIAELNEETLKFIFYDKKEKTIIIEKKIDQNLPEIMADPVQIKQALLNIYLNAIQAMSNFNQDMPEKKEKKLKIKISLSPKEANTLSIIIQDTGTGLSKENLSKVFEPFFTTRQSGGGLGLSITRKIIEGHGGKIMLRNIQPHGAEVDIMLPIQKMKQ